MEGEESTSNQVSSKAIIHKNEGNNKTHNKRKEQPQGRKSNAKELLPLNSQAFQQLYGNLAKLQMQIDSDIKEEQRKFIKQNVVPLNNKHVPAFSVLLREILIEEERKKFEANVCLEQFQRSLDVYLKVNQIYRQSGVNTPILSATFEEFSIFWGEQLNLLPSQQAKLLLIKLWREIPYQNLKSFLQRFNIYEYYYNVSAQQLIAHLSNDLFECRTQQAVEYYHLYTINRQIQASHKALLEKFQQQQLIPRLTKKDQLFTECVLNLIRKNEEIGQKIYAAIDIQEEEKLMNLIGDDPQRHQRVIQRATRRHYRDIAIKNKVWYIAEDKLSYSPTFIQWYSLDILGKRKHSNSESEGERSSIKDRFLNNQQTSNISISIRARLNSDKESQIIKNPLYEFDAFRPAELLMQELEVSKTAWKAQDFIALEEDKVQFIDQTNEKFSQAATQLLNSKVIGFDSEFMPTESKFENGGVSIIQLATSKNCFIFDYNALRNSLAFIDFFITLIQDPKIIKVGHTFSSDFQYLSKNFPKKLSPQGLIDIAKLFKEQYPQQLYTSLAYLTHKFLGKQLCKYEQRSNWARRPLKKTQLYYAALDADVCLAIYDELVENKTQDVVTRLIHVKSDTLEEDKGIYEFNFQKYSEYTKSPIFLIDNMLKKLCSTMRNCGIDADYISIRDHQLAESQSKKEKRIIITRDSKLAQRKAHSVPVYLLKENCDTDLMFQEILSTFSIDLANYKTLSRCVKCNCSDIIVITMEEAAKEIKFLYENKIRTFWRCAKCRQIYWQGGQFERAKNKFDALKKTQS